ncbi:MAG: ATP-dependent helicase HrpB [Pirellulales bacterium]
MQDRLPIDDVLPELIGALRAHASVVLQAPTGAGKTTRVPVALWDAGLSDGRQIVMLEPRRIAARAAARRMSDERGTTLGELIGYQVRFERKATDATRVLVVTEGLLLRMLQDDPFLEHVGVVVFDEFHERSLDADLALGMMRLLQTTVRPDLKLVVMSATLAGQAVAKYLGDAPLVTSQGRLFPVEVEYAPRPPHQPWPEAVERALDRILPQRDGDVLVFLPGVGEIHQTSRQLQRLARDFQLDVVPLYGDLPPEQQDAALSRGGRRRVVLATNVAETSVTVQGVAAVIDTGQARILTYDPAVGLDRLELAAISQASADQRAGRAGRLQPGCCVRLWSPQQQAARAPHTEPEVRRADLAGAILQLLSLGENDVSAFPWFEPPRAAAVDASLALLERLGAVRARQLTPLGRILARLPVHPRLGRLLIEGHRLDCLDRIALAAALLAERDPFSRRPTGPGAPPPRASTRSDLLERVEALEEFHATGRLDFPPGALHRSAARNLFHARDQLVRLVRSAAKKLELPRATGRTDDRDEAFMRALYAAFPDRLAKRREPGGARGVMVGGRGVRLDPASGVVEPELFVCIALDAGQGETRVRQASAVERAWLPADQLETSVEVAFDEATQRVSARRRTRFGDLLLDETPAALPPGEETARVLAEAAAARFTEILPPPDSDAGKLLLRWQCLRTWMPELELPAVDAASLAPLLPWVCAGCRSFDDLRRADWSAALASLLTPVQAAALRREAPERIEVPSGSRIALEYSEGRPPVLAVRIQEVFGLQDTPRIAGGRVRVLLHLLGPNYRPQQVTDDLASFWSYAYQEVRKELRRRYPKHSWPEDPRQATAERKPQRKRPD